jgi:hypothetical protein
LNEILLLHGWRKVGTSLPNRAQVNFLMIANLSVVYRKSVLVDSSGSVALDNVLSSSVRRQPDVDALATVGNGEAAVARW